MRCVKIHFTWQLRESASASSSACLRLGVSRMRSQVSPFFQASAAGGPQGEGEILGRTVTKVKEEEKSWHKTANSSIASPRHWTWHPSSWRSCHLWNIDFCHLHQLEDIMPGNGWELLQSPGIACWILNPELGDAVGIVFRVYNQYMRGGLLDNTRARAVIRYISHHI